jgi:hypothetical protein
MRQVGGSLGIAVTGALVATAVSVPPFSSAYPEQFVTGYHRALELGAALLLFGAALAAVTIRKVEHEPQPAAAEAAFSTVDV